MTGYSIARLRRWGIGWWSIAKCVVGLHHGWVSNGRLECGRCGRVMVP